MSVQDVEDHSCCRPEELDGIKTVRVPEYDILQEIYTSAFLMSGRMISNPSKDYLRSETSGEIPVAFRIQQRSSDNVSSDQDHDGTLSLRAFFVGSVMPGLLASDVLNAISDINQNAVKHAQQSFSKLSFERRRRELNGLHVSGLPVVLLANRMQKNGTASPFEIAMLQPGDVVLNAQGLPYYVYHGPENTVTTARSGLSKKSSDAPSAKHSFIDLVDGALRVSTVLGWNWGEPFRTGRIGHRAHELYFSGIGQACHVPYRSRSIFKIDDILRPVLKAA